jgi:hypothetical protein
MPTYNPESNVSRPETLPANSRGLTTQNSVPSVGSGSARCGDGDNDIRSVGRELQTLYRAKTDVLVFQLRLAGLQLWKSTDGGASFTEIQTPHGDNHDL